MAAEQDWCLECGRAATTRVVPPPSWRLPVAVAAGALALLAGIAAAALTLLADDADRAASGRPDRAAAIAPTATAPAARRPARTATAPAAGATTPARTETVPGAREATGGGPVPVWPAREEAYTVVAETTSDRAGARRRARELIAAGEDAGVLRTDGYDFFSPGYWVVWVGRHPDRAAAERAAPEVRERAPGAYVTLVRRRAGADRSGQGRGAGD